jgi:serine/threonine protein phosphatase PrpC
MWRTVMATDSYRPGSEDRAGAFSGPNGTFAVVADGMGGRSGGAEAVLQAVQELAERLPQKWDPVRWMATLDTQMAVSGKAGETTGVVAHLTPLGPVGVAVGDSVAWWITADDWGSLTTASTPKPWVG